MMMKSLLREFLVLTMVIGLLLVGTVYFGMVQASTDVPSIINSDTTWTKANSPYELKGPTLVSNGVTLTVEPGATVNLNDYYIQVNGTLIARGSSTDQIHLNGGIIRFTEFSSDWNEQTGSGCIIENADLSSTRIDISNSPKINNNSIYEINVDGSPTISENTILGHISIGGSPAILHNSITNSTPFSVSVIGGSPTISYNEINCRIWVSDGSPTISYNTVNDGVHVDSRGGTVSISNNTITSFGDFTLIFIAGVPAVISNNTLIGTGTENKGIHIGGPYGFSISSNIISNCSAAIEGSNAVPLIIENNMINNNKDGISLTISSSIFSYVERDWISPADYPLTIRNNFITDNSGVGISLNHPFATIMNNTIANNYIGITISELSIEYSPSPTILYNNIYANEYNLKSVVPDNLNATYNWWGTTDIPTINQTIYDFKYDFNVGTVNFVPFLTESNPEIPEFSSWIILPLFLVATFVVMICRKRLAKRLVC